MMSIAKQFNLHIVLTAN